MDLSPWYASLKKEIKKKNKKGGGEKGLFISIE